MMTNRDCLVRNGARSGALGGIRTPDTWFRRPVLYPLSYERPSTQSSLPDPKTITPARDVPPFPNGSYGIGRFGPAGGAREPKRLCSSPMLECLYARLVAAGAPAGDLEHQAYLVVRRVIVELVSAY